MSVRRTCYDSCYPFRILTKAGFRRIDFESDMCELDPELPVPEGSRVITSDDVFDSMLSLRVLNEEIDSRREGLLQEYLDAKYSEFHFRSMEDYEQLRKVNMAKSKTQSGFVRGNLMDNVRELSNGESAFVCFAEKIKENARYFGRQFIISTHSPFILSMKNAKIYDPDENPVDIKRWTELKNVWIFYDFFKEHGEEFC